MRIRSSWSPVAASLVCGAIFLSLAARASAAEDGASVPSPAPATDVVSPEQFLKRPVGTDFELADWSQVSAYYRALAEASPCVELQTAGETTEGREFLIAIVSSPENLARLDDIKRHARTIADPRGKSPAEREAALRDGKVVLFVTPTMHATEVAATEMGMQLTWQLATSNEEPFRSARENAVVVITPSLNPDGVDHVVEWYRRHVLTHFEGTSLNKLYQFYTGHDNNRDWFMLTQKETRILTRLLYKEWFPQVLWDVHQQGSSNERFFVPPYRDPLNPNLDPGIVAGLNLIGTRAAMDMLRDGHTGVATGVSYDNWWNGGNRSVPCRHNIIGILTEAASARIATPMFFEGSALKDPLGGTSYQPSNQFISPWPGGWWRLKDIIAYELSFGRSLLGSLNREPRFWLSNAMEAADRNIAAGAGAGPRAWLIPVDNVDLGATRRLLDVLLSSGVEVHVSTDRFTADGRDYPAGTIVLWRNQPYGGYVKDLFERQEFPPGIKPYDVTGWTLPLLLGVKRTEVSGEFQAATRRVEQPVEAMAAFRGDARVAQATAGSMLSGLDSDTWTKIVKQLAAGQGCQFVPSGEQAGLFLPAAKSGSVQANYQQLKKLPRIGVYAPWSASMDEGWLRWVFDHFEIPFQSVRNEAIRAGDLRGLVDVLILPDVAASELDHGRSPATTPAPFADGLDPEGSLAVAEFVREGGVLIAMDGSCQWVVDLLRLPLKNVLKDDDAKSFLCPGSVLRGVIEPTPLTAGLPDDLALFFSGSTGWRAMTKTEREAANLDEFPAVTHLRYAPTRLLLSGYIETPKAIEGHSAWLSVPCGQGSVHLFGFRPHYRGWSQGTFHLLFRAMLLDAAAQQN
jgi:hypothetical protein